MISLHIFCSEGLQQPWSWPKSKNPRILHIIHQSHRSQCSVGPCARLPSVINTGHGLLGGGVTNGVGL